MHNQEEHIRGAVVILRPGGGGSAECRAWLLYQVEGILQLDATDHQRTVPK